MAEDRGDGERPHARELPADPERDVHEVLRGEGMPAQWKGLPIKTQLEMLAGRNALASRAAEDNNGNLPDFWKWAADGEKYLRHELAGSHLHFFTTVVDGRIELTVYRYNDHFNRLDILFKVLEKPEYFVSELTVAKILMVM